MANNAAVCESEVDYTGIDINSIKNPTCFVGRKKLIGDTFKYPIEDFTNRIDIVLGQKLPEIQENEKLEGIVSDILFEANCILEACDEYKNRLVKSGEYFIKDDGKIKGVNLGVNASLSLIFQIFIDEDGKYVSTSRSINYHGFNDAFDKIIVLYCKTWGVELTEEIKKKFDKAKKIYRKEYDNL